MSTAGVGGSTRGLRLDDDGASGGELLPTLDTGLADLLRVIGDDITVCIVHSLHALNTSKSHLVKSESV